MTKTTNEQANTKGPSAFGEPVHVVGRIKYWTPDELASVKGVSEQDVMHFVDGGKLPFRVSPATKKVYLPSNADILFDRLMFGESAYIQQIETPSNLNQYSDGPVHEVETPTASLINVIQLFDYGDKPKVLSNLKGMSIKASKMHKVIQLRQHKNDKYFELISYPIAHKFDDEDLNTLIAAHKRFRSRITAGMPWKDKSFLLNEGYRGIRTFYDLFEFHKESTSKKHRKKISRIQARYFSGAWGNRLIANYCTTTFKADYLDRPEPSRKPSDRNEVIKMVKAAINKAKQNINIKIKCQDLVAKGERSRADKSDKVIPKLNTLVQFITQSYKLGFDRLGLSLIIQLMASTRKTRTNHLSWERIKLDKGCIEVPCHENKTEYRLHPIPIRLIEILNTEKAFQKKCDNSTKNRIGEPTLMFESPYNKGRVLTILENQLEKVREELFTQVNDGDESIKELKEIKQFTKHRIRDLVEKLLKDVGATDGQKEKCLGRKPSELSESYGALDVDTLVAIKNRMVTKIESEHPELKTLFQSLYRQEKMKVLEFSGVKKGVKNLSKNSYSLIV